MNELVYKGANNQAVTTSVMVAKEFGKQHKHVLESIDKLISTAENSAVSKMFLRTSYQNSRNQSQPMYEMNRDGFTLLAMSFTGAKAMQFKLNYINAFNAMEQHIKAEPQPRQLSQAELLLQSAQLLVDIETRQKEQETRTLAIEQKLEQMEKDKQQAQLELFDETPLSENDVPENTLRTQINNLVAKYAEASGIEYRYAWRAVYDEMRLRYHVIFQEDKNRGIRKIDEVERRGFLPKMHDVISFLIRKRNDSNPNT